MCFIRIGNCTLPLMDSPARDVYYTTFRLKDVMGFPDSHAYHCAVAQVCLLLNVILAKSIM